ncbi:MAG: hypothetical protein ACQEW9_01780 [Bacteroidota bacterium]
MKKVFIFWIALIFCSCEREESSMRTDQNLSQTLIARPWLLSVFEVNSINRTGDFEGVNFNFLPTGQVEVYRGSQLLNEGAWTTGVEGGRVVFELSFVGNPAYEGFNRKWYQTFLGFDRITFRVDEDVLEDRLVLQSWY